MRKPRVCSYGGTALPEPAPAFVTELARTNPEKLTLGDRDRRGFLHFADSPDAISTDHAALKGARKHARAARVTLRDCFEAWLPEPHLDRNREKGDVVRMGEQEHGITVRKTALCGVDHAAMREQPFESGSDTLVSWLPNARALRAA